MRFAARNALTGVGRFSVRRDRRHTRTGRGAAFFLFVALACVSFVLAHAAVASAAAAVSVSKTVTHKPLLGGEATCRITVTNTGDTKGYDLSLTDVLSSSRPDPQGRVSVVSVRDESGALFPTAVRTDPATGDTTISLQDIRDLAAGESYVVTVVVSLAGDATWQVGDLLNDSATATLKQNPDGSGATYTGSSSASAQVVPVKLAGKSVQQSTGVHQATGTQARQFEYTLTTHNNYVSATDAVVLTDTLPDGVEFLGVTSGPAPDAGYPSRNATTGVTTVRWTLGTMAAAEVETIRYAAGIRYDYYGTANGGTNRPADDWDGTPRAGRPIPDKTTFTNTCGLTASFQGAPVTDSADASVTGAYLTISKGADVTTGGNGTVVAYTLTYSASEYYDILEHASPDSIVVRDTVPNGMTYVAGSASPTPTSVTVNTDGTTDLVWGQDVLDALPHGGSASITFRTAVDELWSGDLSGLPIVAGDSLVNTCSVTGWWHDVIDPSREDSTSDAASSATFSTGRPGVLKDMQAPGFSVWTDAVTATVGDVLRVRVRFNTNNGSTPTRSDIRFGRITLTDWLPPGIAYNDDAVVSYSRAADFSQPPSFPALNFAGAPLPVSTASLNGLQWSLGNVEKGGWWQAEFTVTVQDVAVVSQGTSVNNLWKMTGVDTAGSEYSDRDAAAIAYAEPHLVLTKSATTVPNPLLPGSTVRYTTTVRNTGTAAAQDVVMVDTLADGMRAAAPVVSSVTLDGTPLTTGTDYKLAPAYSSATGVFTIDFHDTAAPAVDTSIPAGATLTIVYDCRVDDAAVAGRTLTNIASTGYNTQADGSGRGTAINTDVATDNTDDAAVALAPLAITKSVSPATPTPVTIGDTLTYTLRCTVRAGMVAWWPSLRDTVNRDGFRYVAGSAALAPVSGSPVSGASFDASTNPDPIVSTTGGNQTRFTWNLANPLDNRGSAIPYVFDLSFQVVITGIEDNGTAWEFWLPTANDQATDSASLLWNTTNPANRPATPSSSAASNSVVSNIRQPLLNLTKTATSSPPYAGGSTVTYRSVISHDAARSRWTAYDILWKDSLAPQLEAPAISSVTRTVGATSTVLTPGVDYVADTTSRPITIDFSPGTTQTSLPTNGTITIVYTARIVPGTGAGAAVTNTADVDWSNAAGSPAGSRVYTDTGPAATWTSDTDTETVTVDAAVVDKTASPTTATIGEIISYRVRVTVPAETRLLTPALSDAIATTGMVYVPGSARLTFVSGSPRTAAALTGAVTESRQPAGSTLTFPLATPIDNSDAMTAMGDVPYVFDVTYDVVITGTSPTGTWIWDPGAPPNDTSDTATLAWNDGAAARQGSDGAAVAVVQPLLRITKTFDQHTLDSAQPVRSTVVIVNDGQSTAYENPRGYDFSDTAPAGFLPPTDIVVTHSSNGVLDEGTDYTVSISGNDLRLEYESDQTDLEPGETLTITYTNDLDPAVATPGRSFTNFADADFASLPPGGGDDMRVYDDDPNDPFDDRAQDSDTVVIAGAAVVKTSGAPGGVATIGQAYDYTVTLAIPRGTTVYRGAVTDVVPDGLTVLAASVSHGSVVYEPQADGTTRVTWTLPTPLPQTLPPAAAIVPTMTIGVRVDDAYEDGDAVNGLPPQDALLNTAEFEWWDEPSGGNPLSAHDDETVTVVEPRLTIDKQVTPAAAAAGDVVTFTVVVGNSGTSAAHDLSWQDDLPAGLVDPPTRPVLLSVVHSALGPLTTASYTADFGSNPVTLDFDESAHAAAPADLPPGATLTITYQATVEGGIASGQELTDTAAISGSSLAGSDDAREYGPIDDSATVTAQAPELTVTKTVTAGATVNRGGTVSFRVAVENTGDAAAYGVDVADTLPDGPFTYVDGSSSASWPAGSSSADPTGSPGPSLDWSLGATLEPGETLTLTFDVAVGRAEVGQYTNNAEGTGEDGAGSAVDPDEDTAQFEVEKPSGGPSVSVDKHLAADQPATVTVGELVTYEIVVTNTGPSAIVTLPLSDTYPTAYLTYDSAVPTPDAASAGRLDWNDLTGAGELAPGDDVTVSVTFVAAAPNRGDPVINTALVNDAVDEYGDTAPDASDDEPAVTVVPPVTHPAVSVDKQLAPGEPDPVVRGRETTFRIVVTNTGDVPLTTVPLQDTFDTTYLEFVSADPAPDDTATAGQLVWNDLTGTGELAPTESVTVLVTFRAIAATQATGDTALVSGATDQWEQPAADVSDTATVGVREPEAHVAVTKELADGQSATVTVGETVAFDIVVRNTGDTPLVTVPLRDTYDEAVLEFASADPDPDDTATAGRLDWDDLTGSGALAPGESLTVRVTFTALSTAESTVNTARVAGAEDEDGREAPEDEEDETVTVAPRPASLSVTKSLAEDQAARVHIGDEVRFAIVVENTGRATLDVVPLTDAYGPELLRYVAADPDPDSAASGELIWNDLTGGGSLAPGESVTVRLRFKALAESAAADDVATVSGATTDDGRTVPDVSDDAEVAIVPRGRLRLVKTVKDVNGGDLLPGDELLWRIEVSNPGRVDVRQVVVTDTVPKHTVYVEGSIAGRGADDSGAPRLRWALGTLKTGVHRVVSFRSRVRSGVPAGTQIRNVAKVVGFEVDPYTAGVGGVVNGSDAALARTSGGGYAGVWASGAIALMGALLLGIWSRGKLLGNRVARDW